MRAGLTGSPPRITPFPWMTTVKKHTLSAESLEVETFSTFTAPVDRGGPGDCICDMAPCGCTRALDCTQG